MPSKLQKERAKRKAKNLERTESSLGPLLLDDSSTLASPIEKLNLSKSIVSRKRGCPSKTELFPQTFDLSSDANISQDQPLQFPDDFVPTKKSLLSGSQEHQINFDTLTTLIFAETIGADAHIAKRAALRLYNSNSNDNVQHNGQKIVELLWNNLDCWLNQEFTYAFLCLLAKNSKRFTIVIDSIITDPYIQINRTERAIRKASFNYDSNISPEVILMPLFFQNHWALVVHDTETGTHFIDSLMQSPSRLDEHNVLNFHPNRITLVKKCISVLLNLPLENIYINICKNISQQPDTNSCGYYICLFSEAWMFNKKSTILEPINIVTEKKRILWHLNELYKNDNVHFNCRYIFNTEYSNNNLPDKITDICLSGNNVAQLETQTSYTETESISTDNQSICSVTCSATPSKRGRPKKARRGPGRPKNKLPTSSSICSTSSKFSPKVKDEINYNFLLNENLLLPFGPIISPINRIVTNEVIQSRNFISQLWSDNTEWFSEDLIYVYQRYLSSLCENKIVSVLNPNFTNMEIQYGPNAFEFNAIENCFNYSEDYDILLMTIFFPGHFALIIFDRTDRANPECLFIDPLPDIDRLRDKAFHGYDQRRVELIKNGICALTPGLLNTDIVIRTINQDEITRQTDGINCGFFVCLFSESYLLNAGSLFLDNLSINLERRRILWHIVRLLINNNVEHLPRDHLLAVNRPNTNYDVDCLYGDCPKDIDGAVICAEPEINTDLDVNLEILSRSSSVLSDTSENSLLRRSPRIQNKNVSNISMESQDSNEQKEVILNPITQRCYKKHEGLPCADVRSKHTTYYYDSGNIGDIICEHCNALLLKSESEKKNGKISSSTCCNHGKISLPPFEKFPSPLNNYLKGESKEAKEFLSLQNVYNSLVAFASISVGHQESSLDGDVCYLLNGEFVRQISSILPGKFAPSFSQLYILDPTTALEHRTQNISYGGDRVNPVTLDNLDKMLRQHHPLAKQLLNFHSQYQKTLVEQGPDSVKNFRLTLIEARDAPVHVRDPSLHPRQVNLPDEGDTLFAIWTENNKPPCLKGIWITNDEGKLHKLIANHPQTDCLCYPLLFPHGEDGYHKNIPRNAGFDSEKVDPNVTASDLDSDDDNISDNQSLISSANSVDDSVTQRKHVSIREYIRYRMAIRKDDQVHNIWSAGGGLTQKFILDYAARIDSDYANFIRRPEFNLRSTLPENILRWLAKNAGVSSTEELGSIVLFRKHDPGTRAYFQHKFYDATTIMARFKKPGYASFFLTFTTNPRWPEISRNFLHQGQRTIDRFDLICRIYEDKLRYLHQLIEKKHILGKMIGQECREFQKKYGGPHMHRIYHTNVIAIPENIENVIWAHIPSEPDARDKSAWANFIRRVRKLLPKYQFHDCGAHCLNSKGRCKKGFPKQFSDITILRDDRPAIYYRPSPQNGGETLTVKRGKSRIIYDNSRVSAYNPYLLVRFETHHNIEFAYGQSTNLKYIYKYPFKGPSFSYIKSKQNNGQTNVDEPAFYAKMLYRSPPEAYSRILSYKYAYLSHVVIPLSLHLPGQQKIYIKPGQQEAVAAAIQAGILPETALTSYWKQWRNDPELKNILFERLPETYSFNKAGKIWIKRKMSTRPERIKKRKGIIGRIYPVSPRNPELFALYLLMKHFPGDELHLKTVTPSHVCDTFIEAARLRGLIDDNNVWIRTLEEGAVSLMPGQMRQLFANILIFGSTEKCIVDGAMLWERFLPHMYDTRCTDAERPARIERGLALLERLLVAQGRQCKDFGLPTPQISIVNDPQRGLNEFFFPQNLNDDEVDATVDTSCYEKGQLNAGQQQFFSLIKSVFTDASSPRLFHLTGDGGSGKTYLLNYIIYQMRRAQKKVIPTASTGMASTRFYSGGTTAHSAFKFGIDIEPGKLPSIPLDSFFGRRIIEAEIIIIDEMTMLDKVLFENIDELCRIMCSRFKHIPFGGKCVIISGDWKQSLPVVIETHGSAAQIAASIQSSSLYSLFHKCKLTESMRVNPNEKEFLKWLDDVGTGTNGDMISIPSSMLVNSREELIDWVFDRGFDIPSNQLLKRLLLATTNRIVDLNNSLILGRFNGNYVDYFSVDSPLEENPLAINAAEFDVAQLNLLNPLGMPHHNLRLKIGSIIVLLINLNTSKGLCNGTRLIVKKLTPNLIEAEAITGGSSRSGITLGIPRYRSTFKDKRPGGVSFERFQFPVRIAFTMTVVKAQGQTCERLGIDFTEEPFSHGQLYTALSRVTSSEGIKIFAPNKSLDDNGDPKIRNIVAQGLQFD